MTEEFKTGFYNKMTELKEHSKECKLKTYKIKAFENQRNWFGTNLTKLTIKAVNEYDCWLQLRDILYKNSKETYDLYDYDLIIDCVMDNWYEEHEEDSKIDYADFDFIVKCFIKLFCENDTLWCEEIV